MVQPLVSIVTPVYNLISANREETFRQMFDSVQQQSYPLMEHVIMDGSSTDGTLDLINELKEKKKNVFVFSRKDNGIFDAMNKSLEIVRGKYVYFLNSDDFLNKQFSLSQHISFLDENDIDMCFSDVDILRQNELAYTHYGTLSKIPFGYFPCHQSVFMKKEKMLQFGGFDTIHFHNQFSDDVLMMRFVHQHTKIFYFQKTISSFRLGGASSGYLNQWKTFTHFFYDLFGKDLSLSLEECELLFHFQCLNTLSLKDNIRLGSKLKKSGWIEAFFTELWKRYQKK